MSLAVGIDVGGTKLLAALVDTATGAVVRRERRPTRPERGGAAVLAECVELASLVAGGERRPVGVGVCELVDPAGRLHSTETVDWRAVDVTAAFGGVGPTVVESDIRAQAVAECAFGAGRGAASALVVTVSTGISHCLVLDGRPWAGARGNAICTGAPLVEGVAGGRALAAAAGVARAEDVLADPRHAALVAAAADALGDVLAMLVNAVDPEVLVVAGGLGGADAYRERAVARMRAGVYDAATAALRVAVARLGDEAGVVGAALRAVDGTR